MPGILHYALLHIFDQREQEGNQKLKVYVSYLEIYNEGLIELLNPKSDPSCLKVKEDSKVGAPHLDGHRGGQPKTTEGQECAGSPPSASIWGRVQSSER